MHRGQSRGTRKTHKICKKTRTFYEIRGKFGKIGGKEKVPEIGWGNVLAKIGEKFQICGQD